MNQKARHICKRKAGSSARKRLRKLHTSEYKNSCFKKKEKDIVLYFKEDAIDLEKLQSVVPSLTSRERTVQAAPSKKKKISRKGKGKRRRESANGREKEKKEEKGKEEKKKEEKMERAVLKVLF